MDRPQPVVVLSRTDDRRRTLHRLQDGTLLCDRPAADGSRHVCSCGTLSALRTITAAPASARRVVVAREPDGSTVTARWDGRIVAFVKHAPHRPDEHLVRLGGRMLQEFTGTRAPQQP